MLKGVFFFILFIVFVIGILVNENLQGRLPLKTETVVSGVIFGVFLLSLMIFLLFENASSVSLYRNAVFVPAEITIKRFSGAHRSPYFEYRYYFDSIEYKESGSLPLSGPRNDVGYTFYVAVDSTHPSYSMPLKKNNELLTDRSWADRQLIIQRKKQMLWWRE